MKTLTRLLVFVAILLLILLLALPAEADSCRIVTPFRKAVVVEKAVVKDVVAVTPFFPFVAVGIPTFNAVYTPPVAVAGAAPGVAGVAPAAPAPAAPLNDQVLEAIKTLSGQVQELNRRIIKLEGQPLPQEPHKPPVEPMKPIDPFNPESQALKSGASFLQQVQNRCASCHDRATASKGNGFVMTEGGKLAQLAPEKVGAVIDEVVSGRMPRGQRMTPEERLAFVQAMIGAK